VKSYVPIYQDWYNEFILLAAPLEATEFEVDKGCTGIWDKAFEFTENLTKLTLPRTLTYIGYTDAVFKGSKALTDIYSYARPAPRLIENPLEGMNKSAITMHVYASALDSYKQLWGEEFNYITMPDPQTVTLTINVTDMGSLRALIEAAVTEKNITIYDVTGITVTGNINQDDLRTLSQMCTGVYSLTTIDLSGASIESNYIGSEVFRDKEKLTKKIAEMQSDLERINQKIELYDAPIKLETGGYGVEDLVTKVVVNGVTRWELKYPETVIPYNAGGVVTEVNEPTFEPTPASDDSVTPTPAY
jgi:hypothetical protein